MIALTSETVKLSDFEKKHLPVITGESRIRVNELARLTVEVGRFLSHDSATLSVFSWNKDSLIGPPHYIERIELFLNGRLIKSSVPVESKITMNPVAEFRFRPAERGTISARALCSLHGYAESFRTVEVD